MKLCSRPTSPNDIFVPACILQLLAGGGGLGWPPANRYPQGDQDDHSSEVIAQIGGGGVFRAPGSSARPPADPPGMQREKSSGQKRRPAPRAKKERISQSS